MKMDFDTKHSLKRGTKFKRLDGKQKASCLTTTEAKQNFENDYIYVLNKAENLQSEISLNACVKFGRTEEAKQIRKRNMAKGKDYAPFAEKEIVGLDFDKMNTLVTSSNKDNLVMQLNVSTESGGKQPYQQNRVYNPKGISPALLAGMGCGTHAILENETRIRRLTPTECERLQTVPDGYTSCVSDTQRYKMLGNGWTVDVIAYIFSFIDFKKSTK